MADSKQSTDERVQVYRQFPKLKLSGPAKIDSRICFGIIFCSSEADAEKLAKRVEARGDTYNGGWQDGKRVGFGTLKYADGSTYKGGWKDDNWNGQGTQTFPAGITYTGEFKDGRYNGQGTLTFPNGLGAITGEWKDGNLVP